MPVKMRENEWTIARAAGQLSSRPFGSALPHCQLPLRVGTAEAFVTSSEVLQFKITLRGIRPPIWRRIQVPRAYTFWDLHVAIQDAMGWDDYHLHEFELRRGKNQRGETIGIPDEEFESGRSTLPGWEVPLVRHFSAPNQKATYRYDFGDDWEHEVLLEATLPAEEGVEYPRCTKGRRACPPEDCGGPYGYPEFLEAIGDPTHPRHEELLEWIGGAFRSEAFDPGKVVFDDPKERWEIAFSE